MYKAPSCTLENILPQLAAQARSPGFDSWWLLASHLLLGHENCGQFCPLQNYVQESGLVCVALVTFGSCLCRF